MSSGTLRCGDELIVDRAIDPAHGHVVVAVVDGELTIKRLHREGERLILKAENPQYPDLLVNPEQNFSIWGVVTRVLHKV
jgi:DNA polymerase V